MKSFVQTFAMLSAVALLSSCGEEGSGTLTVKGAGSTNSATSILNGFSEAFFEPDDLLPVAGAVSPTELNIQVYEFWISQNTDCSNPVVVFSDTNPEFKNLLTSGTKPDLGSGSPEPGSYPCLIMLMSDNISFTTSAGDGDQCAADTEYTFDVCGTSGGGGFDYPDTLPGGSQGGFVDASCAAGDQVVPVYLSTASTASAGGDANGFTPPQSDSDSARGFNLSGPLVLSSAGAESFFVVDGTNRVVSESNRCDMQPPSFGFVTPTTAAVSTF